MEALFGTDFSDIRVHVGREASCIGAHAFACGTDLFFSPGQYDPHSSHGQRLLGHELAHVIQQRSGRIRNPFGSGYAVVNDPALEAEADRMAARVTAPARIQAPVATGRHHPPRHAAPRPPTVQRSSFHPRRPPAVGSTLQRALKAKDYKSEDHLCGGFVREITWELDNSDKGPGIIVQHVKKEFVDVAEVGSLSTKMSASDIKTYTKDNDGGNDIADLLEYWEAWEVPSGKTVPHYNGSPTSDYDDRFGVPCIFKNKRASKDTTVGHLRMTGTAHWYAGNYNLSTLGMKVDKSSPAGILPMSKSDPKISAKPDSTVTRVYDAKWDSTKKAKHTGEYGPTQVTQS
jgi:hypothetical protein